MKEETGIFYYGEEEHYISWHQDRLEKLFIDYGFMAYEIYEDDGEMRIEFDSLELNGRTTLQQLLLLETKIQLEEYVKEAYVDTRFNYRMILRFNLPLKKDCMILRFNLPLKKD